jgi:hypothetical protein
MGFRAYVIFFCLMLMTQVAGPYSRQPESAPDPFGFLQPTIRFSENEKRTLDGRAVIVRVLPADGHELAALAAGAINVGPEALIASTKDIAGLKRSPVVPQVGRFSTPPQVDDLKELTLDDSDVDTILKCRPERCGLKLLPEEINRLRQAVPSDGGGAKSAVESEFRHVMLGRVKAYLLHGDQTTREQFATLMQHSPYMQWRMPQLLAHLDRYPAIGLAGSESFLYWSKETYAWKPMISVTHVTIVRGRAEGEEPEVIIASRDIFATRYTSGSLVLTLLFRDSDSSTQRYLVYINRTWVDGVRGLWRPFVEHRIKSQAKKFFAAARERIEGRAASASASKQ